MKIPILFIIFNRPDTTKKVFDAIKKYKPKELFIAADGPRTNKPIDKNLCEETRRVVANVDWDCKVKRLYRKQNLGCKVAVSSAIDWFFENEEMGVILEDDCLPDNSFFRFCAELLFKFKNNEKIMHISGDNYLQMSELPSNEYYFSRYPNIWGWATWRRAWRKYSVSIKGWRERSNRVIFNGLSLVEKLYWSNNFDMVSNNLIDTWDYQWVYTVFNNGGYTIAPGSNLVTNIGLSNNATHSNNSGHMFRKVGKSIFPLKHKKNMFFDKKRDLYTSKFVYFINIFMIIYQFFKITGILKVKHN